MIVVPVVIAVVPTRVVVMIYSCGENGGSGNSDSGNGV